MHAFDFNDMRVAAPHLVAIVDQLQDEERSILDLASVRNALLGIYCAGPRAFMTKNPRLLGASMKKLPAFLCHARNLPLTYIRTFATEVSSDFGPATIPVYLEINVWELVDVAMRELTYLEPGKPVNYRRVLRVNPPNQFALAFARTVLSCVVEIESPNPT